MANAVAEQQYAIYTSALYLELKKIALFSIFFTSGQKCETDGKKRAFAPIIQSCLAADPVKRLSLSKQP